MFPLVFQVNMQRQFTGDLSTPSRALRLANSPSCVTGSEVLLVPRFHAVHRAVYPALPKIHAIGYVRSGARVDSRSAE